MSNPTAEQGLPVPPECPQNPRGPGDHCYHGHDATDGLGLVWVTDKCCWCGKSKEARIVHTPPHGPHVPQKKYDADQHQRRYP